MKKSPKKAQKCFFMPILKTFLAKKFGLKNKITIFAHRKPFYSVK